MNYLFLILIINSLCICQPVYTFIENYDVGSTYKYKEDNLWSFEMPQGITETGTTKNLKIKCLGYKDGFLLLEETMTDLVATRKTLSKISADHRTNALLGIPYILYIDTLSGKVDRIETEYKEHEELIQSLVLGIASMTNYIYPFGKSAINIKIGQTWSPPPDSQEIYMGDQGIPNYMVMKPEYTLNKVKEKKGIDIAYISAKYIVNAELYFFQDSKLFEGKVTGTMKDKLRFDLDNKKLLQQKLSCSMEWDIAFEGENMKIVLDVSSKKTKRAK